MTVQSITRPHAPVQHTPVPRTTLPRTARRLRAVPDLPSSAPAIGALPSGAVPTTAGPRQPVAPDPRIRDFERLLAGLPTGPAVLIDVPGRRLLVDGAEVPLTLQEFDLVVYLARAAGRVVTREELYESAWHRQTLSPVTRTVDVHVRRVRAKSGLDALITTVRGVGYRLNPIDDLHVVG